jgi:hypothetical protein
VVLLLGLIIILYGWFQSGDPDCILDTDILMQARLCGEDYVGDPSLPSPWLLGFDILAMLAGIFCIQYGLRNPL